MATDLATLSIHAGHCPIALTKFQTIQFHSSDRIIHHQIATTIGIIGITCIIDIIDIAGIIGIIGITCIIDIAFSTQIKSGGCCAIAIEANHQQVFCFISIGQTGSGKQTTATFAIGLQARSARRGQWLITCTYTSGHSRWHELGTATTNVRSCRSHCRISWPRPRTVDWWPRCTLVVDSAVERCSE
jgi:hypothetical protein